MDLLSRMLENLNAPRNELFRMRGEISMVLSSHLWTILSKKNPTDGEVVAIASIVLRHVQAKTFADVSDYLDEGLIMQLARYVCMHTTDERIAKWLTVEFDLQLPVMPSPEPEMSDSKNTVVKLFPTILRKT